MRINAIYPVQTNAKPAVGGPVGASARSLVTAAETPARGFATAARNRKLRHGVSWWPPGAVCCRRIRSPCRRSLLAVALLAVALLAVALRVAALLAAFLAVALRVAALRVAALRVAALLVAALLVVALRLRSPCRASPSTHDEVIMETSWQIIMLVYAATTAAAAAAAAAAAIVAAAAITI